MFAIFRIGRYALQASGSRGPAQAPQPWGWFGRLVFAAIIIGVISAAHWWIPVLCFGGSLTVLTVIVALCVAGNDKAKRAAKPDPLEAAMRDLAAKTATKQR